MPYRHIGKDPAASVEILLVTSRDTGRWVIPKGNVDFKAAPHVAAACEAEEEGGVQGKISAKPLGRYRYVKHMPSGAALNAKVVVFPLAVNTELDRWKEMAERERRWFSCSEAADAVDEIDLGRLIRSFGEKLAKRRRAS